MRGEAKWQQHEGQTFMSFGRRAATIVPMAAGVERPAFLLPPPLLPLLPSPLRCVFRRWRGRRGGDAGALMASFTPVGGPRNRCARSPPARRPTARQLDTGVKWTCFGKRGVLAVCLGLLLGNGGEGAAWGELGREGGVGRGDYKFGDAFVRCSGPVGVERC